jgi:Immunoglobulin domain/Regulator of chromosome condensation (RCC1) repeat
MQLHHLPSKCDYSEEFHSLQAPVVPFLESEISEYFYSRNAVRPSAALLSAIISSFAFFLEPSSSQAAEQSPLPNVRAWGDNRYGQCDVPADLTNAVAVAAGNRFSAAITADGYLRTWGNMGFSVPADATNIASISAGCNHLLALRQDGSVLTLGSHCGYGQLLDPSAPSSLTNATEVSAGFDFSLALTSSGKVVAWGARGSSTNVPASATNLVAIAAGIGGQCIGIREDGRLIGWGSNSFNKATVPSNVTNATAVSAGDYFSGALLSDGDVRLWGMPNMVTNTPSGISNTVEIAAKSEMLVLTSDGLVFSWNTQGPTATPVDLPFVSSIAVGGLHKLAIVDPERVARPPSILLQPRSQTVAVGSSAGFAVKAAGLGPFRYQWFHNDQPISGATNSMLLRYNLLPYDSGAYFCEVLNEAGVTRSSVASLAVLPALDVNMVPAITLIGAVGHTYSIQYINTVGPTNAWVTLSTFQLTNNPQTYFDTTAIGKPQRIYRLEEQ